MTEKQTAIKCPTCQKTLYWTSEYPFKPFCSERCKLIDLGAWANDSYALPSDTPLNESELEDLEKKLPNKED